MEFFGYRIEKISDADAKELERARAILEKHGMIAVKKPKTNENKARSALRASAIKAEIAKGKVIEAMARLHAEGESITIAKVATIADVSRNTAKKYMQQQQS